MTILTDEMIEKAGRAAYLARYPGGSWPNSCLVPAYKADARACLEAALPEILEVAAQKAEGPIYKERYRGDETANWAIDRSDPYGAGRIDSAAAIRSLLNKDSSHE